MTSNTNEPGLFAKLFGNRQSNKNKKIKDNKNKEHKSESSSIISLPSSRTNSLSDSHAQPYPPSNNNFQNRTNHYFIENSHPDNFNYSATTASATANIFHQVNNTNNKHNLLNINFNQHLEIPNSEIKDLSKIENKSVYKKNF